MLNEILPIGENVLDFKGGESSMDPNCAVEKLSVSLQSCDPFCTTAVDSSNNLVAPDTLRTDVIVCALNSISIAEFSGQKDDEGKDNVKCDDASETKCPDIVCSSPRRSTSMSGMKQKTETKRAVRRCRTTNKKQSIDLILLQVARRRRSCLCKKARVSEWGSLGNIGHVFKPNADVDVNQNERKKSLKARSSRGGGKRNKNQRSPSSQRSKEESHASTGRIRLKVLLRKEVGQKCLMDTTPFTENDGKSLWGTRKESPKFTKDIKDKSEEEILRTGVQYCSVNMEKEILLSGACVQDVVHLADKDMTRKVDGKIADGHNGIPTQEEFDVLELAVENRCLDSGTSPDSEVINLIPQIGEKVPEVFDDVLFTSQDCVALGDVSNLNLSQPSSKKGNDINKLHEQVNCSVEGQSFSPEIIDNDALAEKFGHLEKMGDVSYSSEASISTTTGNACVNASSKDIFSIQDLHPSGATDLGVSTETLNFVNVTEGDLCSRGVAQHDSSESGIPEKFLPYTKPKGHKLSKSSRSTKSRSEAPQSVCSKGNSFRQKGNQSNCKVKEKGDSVQVSFKEENYSKTGNHTLADLGEFKSGRSTTPDVSYLDMVPSGVRDHFLPPHNAWVSCDHCFKWRRISAVLADYIEETKNGWICKDNMDKTFADCSIPQEKSNAEINAELEISDASCEEDAGDALLNSNRLGKKQPTVSQQSSWKLIRSNLFLHRTRKTQTIDEIMVCHCKASLGGRMGCGDGCLNRMLNIECVKGTCPCGELCSNRQFQQRKYAKLKCFRSGKKGYGLQLLEDIRKGQFLIEYVGEVLDMHAYEDRQREYALKGHKHFYFMTLNGGEVIDACAKGNLGRFINHSCEPNCRTEKWMVNGEVCIGLFALRDIKKGEEVTFDYNYVRVFGAAAKKCVCGSSQCRGYIGADPLNAEVIVQCDSDEEYLEPVMVCEDGDFGNTVSAASSVDFIGMRTAEKDDTGQPANAVEHLFTEDMHTPESSSKESKKTDTSATAECLEMSSINEDSTERDSSAGSKLESSMVMDGLVKLSPFVQTIETFLHPDDGKGEITSAALKESSVAEETLNRSFSTVQRSETSLTKTLSKSVPDYIDIKRKSKYDPKEDRHVVSTSRPVTKTSHPSSSVKKGKSRMSVVHVNKPAAIVNKSHVVPYKSKKLIEGSSNDSFEAVEVKLNELLDADGGISKRRDASRGYLKLLFLTAASGDSANGEAIQSNRDLSMILDALLKTKSRTVLVDIISKNGLQMLHNIMKRYRKEFHKIPILRKLLKVLEFLAVREILTLEHITSGPRCAGVESFRESILSLTEHIDKQVHKIARNFRDKWIPRPVRRNNYMGRDVHRMDFHRSSALYNQSYDLGGRPPEAIDRIKQPVSATTTVGAGSLDSSSTSCSTGCVTNETRIRKRKSRWDQPAETNLGIGSPPHKEPRIQPRLMQKSHLSPQPKISEVMFNHIPGSTGEDKNFRPSMDHSSQQSGTKNVDDGWQNFDEDVPPGFSPPFNGLLVSPTASSTAIGLHQEKGLHSECPSETVMGHPQERFILRLPVAYGLPLPVVQQLGTPQGITSESWAVAAGIPFQPYPPLPPYPCDKRGHTPAASSLTVKLPAVKVEEGFQKPNAYHADHNTPITYVANPLHMEISGSINQQNFERKRSSSSCLGGKYFKQPKWNNSKLPPPWVRNRTGHENMGNNRRNGMNGIGIGAGANEPEVPYSSEQVNFGVMSYGNTFYQHPQHQN